MDLVKDKNAKQILRNIDYIPIMIAFNDDIIQLDNEKYLNVFPDNVRAYIEERIKDARE
jgi:hypothetical protein